jgi:hypothetical protein
MSSAINNIPSFSGTIDTFSVLVKPLKVFNSIANEIANVQPSVSLLYITDVHMQVHPYVKVALSIFTYVSKVGFFLSHHHCRLMRFRFQMILDQADHDVAVSDLLKKISEVYTLIMEEEELAKIQSMLAIYGKIAQQILECTDFICHYSETKSTCELIPLFGLLCPNTTCV